MGVSLCQGKMKSREAATIAWGQNPMAKRGKPRKGDGQTNLHLWSVKRRESSLTKRVWIDLVGESIKGKGNCCCKENVLHRNNYHKN